MPVPPMLSSLVPSRRLSAALVLCGMVAACTNAPVTGRQQLILLPEG